MNSSRAIQLPTFHKIILWKIPEIPKKARVNNNYGLVPYNDGVVMIKKPINPKFNHSNRFLTDYIPQNFTFTYAYVATPGAQKSAPGHSLFLLLNIILKSFTKYFVSSGVLNMIDI